MSHTFFSASPFKPAGYNQSVMPLRLGYRPVRARGLGQFGDALEIVGEFFDPDDIGLSDIENLLEELDNVLGAIPVDKAREDFGKRRDECVAEDNIIKKFTCLRELSRDVEAYLKGEEAKAPPTGNGVTPTTKPPEDTFPWIPVGIAAGLGVAALAYFAFRKKK